GNRNDLKTLLGGEIHNSKSRIAYQRRARVRYEGNVLSAGQKFAEFFGAFKLVVFVITNCFVVDAEMVEQFPGVTCILARNQIDFAQNAQCPLGNVFEIPDWRRDNIKSAAHS